MRRSAAARKTAKLEGVADYAMSSVGSRRQRVGRLPSQPLARARREITGHTRVVGIFGDPVEHSLSPAMHNAAFAALGLDFVYVAFHVDAHSLRSATRAIRALGLVGVNVTVPHKERILPLLDSCSVLARRVGAVNTVVNRGGQLWGENTDVHGVLVALREARFRARGKKAVVIGAGGAARAVIAALVDEGLAELLLVNRSLDRARSVARRFRSAGIRISVFDPSILQSPDHLRGAALVVNTTSLGLAGERFFPMETEATLPSSLFFDVVYGRETEFLKEADRAGRQTLGGLPMLLHQGARAFEIWTGRRAPLAIMRHALEQALVTARPHPPS